MLQWRPADHKLLKRCQVELAETDIRLNAKHKLMHSEARICDEVVDASLLR